MLRDELEKMAREAVAEGAQPNAMDILDLLIKAANKMNTECANSLRTHEMAVAYFANITSDELLESLKMKFDELRVQT